MTLLQGAAYLNNGTRRGGPARWRATPHRTGAYSNTPLQTSLRGAVRRRGNLSICVGILLLLLAGCAAVGYKSIPVAKSSPGIDAVVGSIYTLKSETIFKKADGSEETVESSGIAIAIAPDLLLSLDHVVSDYEISYSTPFGQVVVPAEKVSEQTYLEGFKSSRVQGPVAAIEAIFRDRQADIALFRTLGGAELEPLSIPFGRSSELRVGDIVYIVGNPFHAGINVRQGIVSALRAPDRVRMAGINPDAAFMVSNGLVPGDSGGPVLAIRDGRFELVGLAQGMIAAAPNLGMALKIEVILEKVQEFAGLRVQELDSQPENLGPLNF